MSDSGDEVARSFAILADTALPRLPTPGGGATQARFDAFVAWGRRDPALARLAEGHADALAILVELDAADLSREPGQRWGVWAAAPDSVRAVRTGGGWRLSGDRPWSSGAGVCTHALVTASADDGVRLFAVAVQAPGVTPLNGTWPALGMAASDSRTVRLTDAPAEPVGGPGEYVDRPGFWHGSIGVAACWFGGAIGVADTLLDTARKRPPDPHALAHLGAVDAAIAAAGNQLRAAARCIDADPVQPVPILARRTRAVVEACASLVLDRVGRALGAGPLCLDAGHARRVADLTVYLRQSHAERDLAELGALVLDAGSPW